MNTLVVYYSRTGHNEVMAKQLQAQVHGDLDQIVDLKRRESMFGSVASAIFRRKTRIEFAKDPAAYDRVIVVSPLWAGSLPPATRTYLAQHSGNMKHFAFLSVCGLGEENKKAVDDIASTAKQQPEATLLIKETDTESPLTHQKFAEFVEQLPVFVN